MIRPLSDESFEVLYTLAGNPNASEHTLWELISYVSYFPQIRAEVARNPNATLEMLEVLSDDNEPLVLNAIVRNPKISTELLIKFADSTHPSVVEAVASNPKTPIDVLRRLRSCSTSSWVRSNAKETLKEIAGRV